MFGIGKILVVIDNYFSVRVILFFVIDGGTFITDVLTLIPADNGFILTNNGFILTNNCFILID